MILGAKKHREVKKVIQEIQPFQKLGGDLILELVAKPNSQNQGDPLAMHIQ